MEIKEIMRQLCNLSDGEYIVESQIGKIEIINKKFDQGKSVTCEVEIKCDNHSYLKITSTPFISLNVMQKLLTKNKTPYLLTHDINNSDNNYITWKENNETFLVFKNKVVNCSRKKEYTICNGLMTSRNGTNESIVFSYHLNTNEKTLYLGKINAKDNIRPIRLNANFIKVKKEIRNIIGEYNTIIENTNKYVLSSITNNERLKNHENVFMELITPVLIPTIDVDKINEYDSEITLAAKVYKKYTSKLNQPYSTSITEILNSIAETLTKQYSSNTEEKKKNKKFTKIFNITKFINK